MNQDAIASLLKEFKKLSITEREKFIDFVSANSSPSDFKFIVDTKLSDDDVRQLLYNRCVLPSRLPQVFL